MRGGGEFLVSSFWLKVSGFWFLVSGFEFRVEGVRGAARGAPQTFGEAALLPLHGRAAARPSRREGDHG